MGDDRMTRVENLNQLMKQRGWNKADLGRAIGTSDTYAGALAEGKKSFGERSARNIEIKLGIPKGWLDQHHDGGSDTHHASHSASEPDASYLLQKDGDTPTLSHPIQAEHACATNAILAPEIEWGSLGAELYKDNDDWPVNDRRIVPTSKTISNSTKWLLVKDDVLSPKVLPGDRVAIDPHHPPSNERLALIKCADGSHILRLWRPLANSEFEVFDSAGRILDSKRHGLSVVGSVVGLYRELI